MTLINEVTKYRDCPQVKLELSQTNISLQKYGIGIIITLFHSLGWYQQY